jgi:hypothetical protein
MPVVDCQLVSTIELIRSNIKITLLCHRYCSSVHFHLDFPHESNCQAPRAAAIRRLYCKHIRVDSSFDVFQNRVS